MAIDKIIVKVDGVETKSINFNDTVSGLSMGEHVIEVEAYNGNELVTSNQRTINVTETVSTPVDGVVSDWDFTSTEGDLIDTINGYNGAVYGGVVRNGSSFEFNGSNSYIELGDKHDHSFVNNTGVEVPFTIRMKIVFDVFGDQWIFSKRGANAALQEWQIYTYQGVLTFQLSDGSGNYIRIESPTTNYSTGVEYVLTFISDGSGTVEGLSCYVNGIIEETFVPVTLGIYTGLENTDTPTLMGKAGFGSTGFPFDGKISKLRVHKGYAWTSQEVEDDYILTQ